MVAQRIDFLFKVLENSWWFNWEMVPLWVGWNTKGENVWINDEFTSVKVQSSPDYPSNVLLKNITKFNLNLCCSIICKVFSVAFSRWLCDLVNLLKSGTELQNFACKVMTYNSFRLFTWTKWKFKVI